MIGDIPGSGQRWRLTITGVAAVFSLAASPARAGAPITAAGAHDIHLTYSRVVIDGASVSYRVRLFRDDLERALQAHGKLASFTLGATPAGDSLFATYLDRHVTLSVGGKRLTGRVVESAPDPQVIDEPMWTYLVEYPAPAPVTTFSLRVALLFELFDDQRNIVSVIRSPGGERRSLYFAPNDAREQVVRF